MPRWSPFEIRISLASPSPPTARHHGGCLPHHGGAPPLLRGTASEGIKDGETEVERGMESEMEWERGIGEGRERER